MGCSDPVRCGDPIRCGRLGSGARPDRSDALPLGALLWEPSCLARRCTSPCASTAKGSVSRHARLDRPHRPLQPQPSSARILSDRRSRARCRGERGLCRHRPRDDFVGRRALGSSARLVSARCLCGSGRPVSEAVQRTSGGGMRLRTLESQLRAVLVGGRSGCRRAAARSSEGGPHSTPSVEIDARGSDQAGTRVRPKFAPGARVFV